MRGEDARRRAAKTGDPEMTGQEPNPKLYELPSPIGADRSR